MPITTTRALRTNLEHILPSKLEQKRCGIGQVKEIPSRSCERNDKENVFENFFVTKELGTNILYELLSHYFVYLN